MGGQSNMLELENIVQLYDNLIVISDLDGTLYSRSMQHGIYALAFRNFERNEKNNTFLSRLMKKLTFSLDFLIYAITGGDLKDAAWNSFQENFLYDSLERKKFANAEISNAYPYTEIHYLIKNLSAKKSSVRKILLSLNIEEYVKKVAKKMGFDSYYSNISDKAAFVRENYSKLIIPYREIEDYSKSYSKNSTALALIFGNSYEDLLVSRVVEMKAGRGNKRVKSISIMVSKNKSICPGQYNLGPYNKESVPNILLEHNF